jgi:RimJ/RimL family protein N-acetyltransferase
MIRLVDITEENYQTVCGLSVNEEQKAFVASPMSILARAYAKRQRNATALAIANGETIIGVIMFMELFEEPACYTIEQFLIDRRYQNMGYGKQALRLVIDDLSNERNYDAVEVCVKRDALQAIKVYKDFGFFDTGYTDPDEPNSYCLRYCL